MRKRKNKSLDYFFILLIMLFLSALSSSSYAIQLSLDQNEKIVYALPYDLNEYSAYTANSYATSLWVGAVYSGLVKRSSEGWVADLAKNMPAISNNGLTFTFELRDNLVFSNGEPLTAEDVEFSLKVAVTPEIDISWYSGYFGFLDNNSINVYSETSFSITLLQQFSFPYGILSFPIVPKDHFSNRYDNCIQGNLDDCIWDANDGSDAIGAGPFMMQNIDNVNEAITLASNPKWYNADKLKTDQLEFVKILDKTSAVNALISGQIDVVDYSYDLTKTEIDTLNGHAKFELIQSDMYELYLNHLHPYFGTGESIPISSGESNQSRILENSRLLRQAMSMIIPRQDYAETILSGYAVPATTMMPIGMYGWDETLDFQAYDLSASRSLMTQLGFDFTSLGTPDQNDQYGSSFFEVTLTYRNGFESFPYNEYAVELSKIGIGLNLNPLNFQDFSNLLLSETLDTYSNGGYDMLTGTQFNLGFAGSWDPSSLLSTNNGNGNMLNFDITGMNTGISTLLQNYLNAEDMNEKEEYSKTLQYLLQYWLPTLPVLNKLIYSAVSIDLIGYEDIKYNNWENISKDSFAQNIDDQIDDSILNLPNNLLAVAAITTGLLSIFIGVAIFLKKGEGVISVPIENDGQKSILSEIFKSRTTLFYYLIGQSTSKNEINEEIEKAIPEDIYKFKFLLNPVRLSMMKLLNETTKLTSAEIKDTLNLSWNDVKTHLSALKQKEYIVTEHQFIDGSRKQVVSITAKGSERFQILLNLLHLFLDSATDIELENFD